MLILGMIEASLFGIMYMMTFTFIHGFNQIIEHNINNYNRQKIILYIKTYEKIDNNFCLNRKFERTDYNLSYLNYNGLNKSIACYNKNDNLIYFKGKNKTDYTSYKLK